MTRLAAGEVAALREALVDVAWSVHAHVERRAKGDRRLYVVHLHETLVQKIDVLIRPPK